MIFPSGLCRRIRNSNSSRVILESPYELSAYKVQSESRPKNQPKPGRAESPDEQKPATSAVSLGDLVVCTFSCSIETSAHENASSNSLSGVRMIRWLDKK